MTNGVTPRRWVHCANPALSAIFTKYLGSHECFELNGAEMDVCIFWRGKEVKTNNFCRDGYERNQPWFFRPPICERLRCLERCLLIKDFPTNLKYVEVQIRPQIFCNVTGDRQRDSSHAWLYHVVALFRVCIATLNDAAECGFFGVREWFEECSRSK